MIPHLLAFLLRAASLLVPGLLLICAPAVRAQQELTDIPLPDPEQERQSFVLPEGCEVNLFAADPAIAKPIQINFDPAGRLWLVSSHTYPQIVPGEQARDKVLILEDTDGDGVSDQTTVFAEDLLIPTGIEPGDGGAYVAASTQLLHLSDTDGDGRADARRIVLSGFGTEDTHHLLHTFRWGPEQRLYFNQSVYIHSHIETPWGVRRLNAGGIWRFRPDDWQLDVFARGWVNPWGLDFDDYGQMFVTDGAGGEGINYVVPGASYTTAFGADRILRGLNPGSPKHCGLEIVSGRHLPDDWQGNCITCDFRGHRVCRFVLAEQGSGFRSQEQTEVIRSDHVAFRPIDVKLGPDGALYIADWYNPIIQHGEVDFRDPRRDHTHGRIWRVTFPERALVERPQLTTAGPAELLACLTQPEAWTRRQARRLLKERGREILPELKQWTRNLDNSTADYHRHRLEGLWVYQALDVVEPELLVSLLRCTDHRVRAAAVRVLGDWQERLPDPLGLLEPLVGDEHPRVRLEAVRALGSIREPRSIEVALRALDESVHPASASDDWRTDDPAKIREADPVVVDEWLDYALWLTTRELQPVWELALLRGEIDFDGNTRHLVFALKFAGSEETVPVLTTLLRDGAVGPEALPDVLSTIAEQGNATVLAEVVEYAAGATDGEVALASLKSLLESHRRRGVRPAGDLQALDRLLASDRPEVKALAARCVGAWQVDRLRADVVQIAEDPQQSLLNRRGAIEGLAGFGDDAAAEWLAARVRSSDRQLHAEVIQALLPLRPAAAVESLVSLMAEPLPADEAGGPAAAEPLTRMFQLILSRQSALPPLVDELSTRTISADTAIVALRAVRSSGQPFPELTRALEQAAGMASAPAPLTAADRAELMRTVEASGEAARGEAVYRRAELGCMKCHAIGGAGGQVGPDLASLGATAQLDYVIDSLLDPDKQVKENYHTMIVLTDAGETVSGIVVRQSDDDLLLRDAEAREHRVPLASVEMMKPGVSLMPAGLTSKLTRAELVDLAAFLKALGRLPEFMVGTAPVARHWEVLEPTEQAAERLRRVSYAAAAGDDPAFAWRAVPSTVAGQLPLADLGELIVKYRTAPGARGVAFVRLKVEATSADQTARLQFNDVAGLSAWWGERPVELQPVTELPTVLGENRLTIAVDLAVRRDDLRVQVQLDSP